MSDSERPSSARPWVVRSFVGIVLATFFSDVGHEMVTAVLPFYLGSVGLGAAALGVMEGLADLLASGGKLVGGIVGHRVRKKNPLASAGYLVTAIGTGAMGLTVQSVALVGLRAFAWLGRGFRSPLRDYLLADAVMPSHFGRAYGIERAADMLGAVTGPLLAVLFIWLGADFRTVILVSIAPALAAVAFIFLLAKDRPEPAAAEATASAAPSAKLPRAFWLFVGGVLLFGLGDFSRTFLLFVAVRTFGEARFGETGAGAGTVSVAVLLYVMHNAVSALAAYPIGRLGDRRSKLAVLAVGYVLGVVTNAVLAMVGLVPMWLAGAIALSGVYIAVEETMEKAAAAEMLPRELRSLGFGVLASANALGDLGSSVYVGVMLDRGDTRMAFGVPAIVGAAGALWMMVMAFRRKAAAP